MFLCGVLLRIFCGVLLPILEPFLSLPFLTLPIRFGGDVGTPTRLGLLVGFFVDFFFLFGGLIPYITISNTDRQLSQQMIAHPTPTPTNLIT